MVNDLQDIPQVSVSMWVVRAGMAVMMIITGMFMVVAVLLIVVVTMIVFMLFLGMAVTLTGLMKDHIKFTGVDATLLGSVDPKFISVNTETL